MSTPGCTGYGCRSQRVIEFIEEFQRKHGGVSPSIREIAAGLGFSSHAYMIRTLQRMEYDGLIENKGPGRARRIKVRHQPLKGPRDPGLEL